MYSNLIFSADFIKFLLIDIRRSQVKCLMKCYFYSGMKSVIFFVCAAICILPGGKFRVLKFLQYFLMLNLKNVSPGVLGFFSKS